MSIPMVASNVPPLIDAANDGLLELLGNATPAQKIDEIFSNYAIRNERAIENRSKFLKGYSYAGNLAELTQLVEANAGHLKPVPDAFRDLVEYQRSAFSVTTKPRKVFAKVVPPGDPAAAATAAKAAAARRKAERATLRAQRSYVDDKFDVVFSGSRTTAESTAGVRTCWSSTWRGTLGSAESSTSTPR